jgi:hypothetical protein
MPKISTVLHRVVEISCEGLNDLQVVFPQDIYSIPEVHGKHALVLKASWELVSTESVEEVE